MSQPPSSTAPQRMSTRAKNKDQHPGLILSNSTAKRRTKAQKDADDQDEKVAREASETVKRAGYMRIAVLQGKMQMEQAEARVDAPKPRRPTPRARPVKAVDSLDTSTGSLKIASAKSAWLTDPQAGDKGKEHRRNQAASAIATGIEHPALPVGDEEFEVAPVLRGKVKSKRGTKSVRDTIEEAGNLIDQSNSSGARDDSV